MLIAATRLERKAPSMVSRLALYRLVFLVKSAGARGVDWNAQRSTFACNSTQCFFMAKLHFSRSRGEPNSTDFIDYVGSMPGAQTALILLVSRKIRQESCIPGPANKDVHSLDKLGEFFVLLTRWPSWEVNLRQHRDRDNLLPSRSGKEEKADSTRDR